MASSSRRARCNYKRLSALKGLERLQNLVPGTSTSSPSASSTDEMKLIIDSMFYITQLEIKVEELKKTAAKKSRQSQHSTTIASSSTNSETLLPNDKPKPAETLSSAKQGDFNIAVVGNSSLPDDLLEVDVTELRELHSHTDMTDLYLDLKNCLMPDTDFKQ